MPFIMTSLSAATGIPGSVSLYIIILAVITDVSVYLITETSDRDSERETTMG